MNGKVGPHVVSETSADNSDSRERIDGNDANSSPVSVPSATSYSQKIHNRITFFRPFETDGSDSNESRPPCIITSTRQRFMDTVLNTNTSDSGSTNSLTSQNNYVDNYTYSSQATIPRIYSMHQTSLPDSVSVSHHGDNNNNRVTERDDRSDQRKTDSLFHPQCHCCSQQSQETSFTNRHAGRTAIYLTHNGKLRAHMTSTHQEHLVTCESTSEHKGNLEATDSISERHDNLETFDSVSEQHAALQSEDRGSMFYLGVGREPSQERTNDGSLVKPSSDSNPPRQWIYDARDFQREDRPAPEDASCEGMDIKDRTVCSKTDLLEQRGQIQVGLITGSGTMSEQMAMSPTDSPQFMSALRDNGIDDNARNKWLTLDDDKGETVDGFETVVTADVPTDGMRGRKGKRNRKIFSPEQLAVLESVFSLEMYPDPPIIQEMADKFGLSEANVLIWFQNRRSKHRKHGRSSETHGTQSSATGYVRHAMPPLFTRTAPDFSRMFQGYGLTRMPSMPPQVFSVPSMAGSSRQPHAGSSGGIWYPPYMSTFSAGASYRPHVIGVNPYNTLHFMPPFGLYSGVSDRPESSLPPSRETNVQRPGSDSDCEA